MSRSASIGWLRVLACGMVALGCGRSQSEAPAPKPEPQVARAVPRPPSPPAPAPAPPLVTPAQHGAELYGRMCAICHGAQGEGYKADQAPALGQQDFLASVSDEFLFFSIAVGRKGTTMSAWSRAHGGPLSDGDVAAVIAFLRSWQRQPSVTLDESPLRGNVARGKAAFKRTCERCHGPGRPNVRILNRQWLAYAKPGFLRHAIRKGRLPTSMIAFEQVLGDRGVEDVVTYLRSLPAWPDPEELVGMAEPPPIPLGPVPLHPRGPEPVGFKVHPAMTSVDVVGPQLARKARMVLLDARAPSDYLAGHIAGAVSVPFYDPSPYLAALPKNAWLVCYCGCPHAESGALAGRLMEAGFSKVTVLDEGLGVWMGKGYPMREGIKP